MDYGNRARFAGALYLSRRSLLAEYQCQLRSYSVGRAPFLGHDFPAIHFHCRNQHVPFYQTTAATEGVSCPDLRSHNQEKPLALLLGLVYNGLLDFDIASLGYCGVLQHIAIAYLFASLIVLHTNVRTQAATAAGLLLSYWALMTFVPVPRFGPGVLTPGENLHAYIDRMVLPGRLYNRVFDEDGLLQQMSSISVALLGAVAGCWLGGPHSGKKKTLGFLAAGAVSICLGLIWHSLPRPIGFPMIFRLWSSSYVLVAVGYASVMLGLFYYIIDVKGYRKWAFPFIVIGLNPLTIYLVQELFDFGIVVNIFLHGVVDSLGSYSLLVVATCVLGTKWLFLYFLYKKRIFLSG